jgi:hypothetical protein
MKELFRKDFSLKGDSETDPDCRIVWGIRGCIWKRRMLRK